MSIISGFLALKFRIYNGVAEITLTIIAYSRWVFSAIFMGEVLFIRALKLLEATVDVL